MSGVFPWASAWRPSHLFDDPPGLMQDRRMNHGFREGTPAGAFV